MPATPSKSLSNPPPPGKVYLIGAGPGDPGLITLRGAECLRRADVVLYDYLVNPELLRHCPPNAECICLGQHGRTRLWSQAEINARVVAEAQLGKTVVRLKSGDPAIFARYAEEVAVLLAANIEWEMVPGITAALAASSFAGVPLTHREFASAVAFITAREDADKAQTAHDFSAYAAFPGTLVFYMGITSASDWTAALIAAGKPRETPVALVRRCSFSDQRIIVCRLDEVAAKIASEHLRPPVISIVGEVANLSAAFSWFDKRPLFGQTILVTRAAEQASGLAGPLRELGAEVLQQPAIEICPPADWTHVDAAIGRLAEFDWLVFSSSNGVRSFLDRLFSTGRDLRALGRLRIGAIGPGTAAELSRFHLHADLIPREYRAEALIAELRPHAKGERFLLLRASRGRELLAEELTAAGGLVEQVVVYDSLDVTTPLPGLSERLRNGEIDWVTVTSSAIARSLVALFGEDLHHAQLVSISPLTTAVLKELGFTPTAEATEYTMAGVCAAIQTAIRP